MPGGHVAIASAVQDGDIAECGAIASPVPVGEIEALLDHLDELGATVQRHLRRGAQSYIPFISQRLQYSASAL